MFRITTCVAAVLLLSLPALAQEPPGGGEEEFDVEAALKEVSKLLTEAESLLVKALKPGDTAEGAANAGEKAREAMDKLLTQGGETGKKVVDKMTEILEKAPQQSGQGQSQMQQQESEEEARKRREQERKVEDRDPKNSGEGKPEDGRKQENRPETSNEKPPTPPKDKPSEPDPNADWLANLPEKVREAYLNGEWEVIPPKWRRLIEEYTKQVAGSDR